MAEQVRHWVELALLTSVFMLPWMYGRDLLSPLRVASFLGLITTVPYVVLLQFDRSVVHYALSTHLHDLDSALTAYLLLQAAAFLALVAGYQPIASITYKRAADHATASQTTVTATRLFISSIVCLAVGGIAFALRVEAAGGLLYLLANLDRRVELLAGTGYYTLVMDVTLTFAVICAVLLQRQPKRLAFIYLVLVVALAFLMFSVFGGRKNAIFLILMSVIAWHYGVHPIARPRLSHVALLAGLVAYFVIVFAARQEGGYMALTENLGALFDSTIRIAQFVAVNLSYVDTYMFITTHFSLDNYWWGRSYLDLLVAPVPSFWMPSKPPIDDGMYIRSLAEGYAVAPPMAAADLYPSSWPPETLGAGYMNFGIVGVVVLMFLLGQVYRFVYTRLIKQAPTPYAVFAYSFVVLNFEFSNLRIVQTTFSLLFAYGLYWLFFKTPALSLATTHR